MKHILVILTLVISVGASAQIFPIAVNPQLVPPYSPYITDYTSPGAQKFMVHIRANDITLANYACKLRMTIEGVGITIKTKPNFRPQPLILDGGGIPQILYGEDLLEYFHPNALDFSGFTRREYEKNARLPEGVYRFTIEVLDYNRNTVVSNTGMTMAWIILNDPPLLNLPANSSKLQVRDPTNILFTWTPRHTGSPNAAFSSEYIFRLVEIWPENRNPYDAFLTQVPLYEAVTAENQLLYTMVEPALTPGRKYAWQVEAQDTEGKDLFKNQGRSEVFVFQYGETLDAPGNFQLRWAKPTTLSMRWDAVPRDGEDIKYRLQYRPRLRRENHQWYQTRTQFTQKTLYHLQPNTEYEMKVRTESPTQESEYTDIRIFKTLPSEKAEFVCKDPVTPPPLPANTLPVFPLSVNDTLHAGGYDVLVRDVIETGGKYFGSGVAIVPWFNGAKVRVTFENIRVNDRFWLTSGVIKSVWNAESEFLREEQTPILPGTAPATGELDITIVAADSLIAIEGKAIASVTKDEAGNIVVTTTAGDGQTLPKGESYAITDDLGNGYVVDKQGNIAKTTATEAIAAAARGDRKYSHIFRFARGDGKFGFDDRKHEALSEYYQQLDDGSYVSWKALSSARPDGIAAYLHSGGPDLKKVRFQAGGAPVTPTSAQPGRLELNIQGKMAGMEEELLALYAAADSLPDNVLGKVNLVTYNPIQYNLEIIPVNGATIPVGLSAGYISERLNAIYGQAVVEWRTKLQEGIEVSLSETFDVGETGLFSNYTADMKKVLNTWGRFQGNTYYLFLINESSNPSTLGYMPRSKQAGFVFVGPHEGDGEEFIKTMAHELGHGAFNLRHTFSEHNLPLGTTDNIMDYGHGTALFKYQWDRIHSPQTVIGLFEEAGEGESVNPYLIQFESALTSKIIDELDNLVCRKQAAARFLEVYDRLDLEMALYAGYLKYLLCITEKENCEKNENMSAYACGLSNGFLQELDWITMLENVAGWSIDPKEILMCILTSFPIGSKPDDNLRMESILFKCLVGIEIKDLTKSIKDFVVENWDEPYYQGQATAFALTLLSPFKAKILAKLAQLPQYVRKINIFKSLSKAGSADELVGISRALVRLIDDAELEKITKAIKYLPGPELPPKIVATFSNSMYSNRKLINNERYFKYHGENNRTGKKYTWVVNKKYSMEKELREGLAIREDWNVEIKYISEFEVPSGTWVSEGKAASKGMGYPGGEYQAVILNVPKTWILKTTKAF